MSKAPAFQMYASDFYMDTVEWSIEEVGIYNHLLHAQWINGSLPNDEVRLARIAGCGTKKFQKGWRIIQFKFKLSDENRLQNPRLEETREEQTKYRELQSEAGKKGAEKRWKKDSDPNGDPNDQNIALQSSSSSSNKKNKNIVEQNTLHPPYSEIISYLNEKAHTHFKPTSKETKRLIKARWNDGFDLGAFQYVIDVKCKQWGSDPKMLSYLRPLTLFGTKFESYLNEVMP